MSDFKYLNDQSDKTEDMKLSNMSIQHMPNLNRFTRLKILNISHNQIKRIYTLPDTLIELNCSYNQLSTLPKLPIHLTFLYCQHNRIKKLPKLPRYLNRIHCQNNQLVKLPKLNKWLNDLQCCFNQLTALPKLNDSLVELYCEDNQLVELPKFPNSLVSLWCPYNQLVKLPGFTMNLEIVNCKHNNLIELPHLYNVTELHCHYNQIRSAPYPINKDIILTIDNNPIEMDLIPYYIDIELNLINIKLYYTDFELLKMFKVLYKVRKLYSMGKIKALIMNYVWVHIRQPKIEAYYHPLNMILELEQNGGDIDALDMW